MNNDKVSIIVPVYNVERYLNRCIDSLINQTYNNLEIILVNDGSPDNSPEICDEYRAKDSRVKVIHQENGGLSDARNQGIDASTGTYIAFVDSDDYAELDMIETALHGIKKYESDILIWGYYLEFVDENENTIDRKVISGLEGMIDSTKPEFSLSSKLIGLMGYAWNKLYKADIIKDSHYQFEKGLTLIEDSIFNSQLFKDHHSIAFIENPLLHYMQRPRETLGKKFYEDQFELDKRSMDKATVMLLELGYKEADIKKQSDVLLFNSLRWMNRVLAVQPSFSMKEKTTYLSQVYNDERILKIIKEVRLTTLKDKVIRILLSHQAFSLILRIYAAKHFIKNMMSRKG